MRIAVYCSDPLFIHTGLRHARNRGSMEATAEFNQLLLQAEREMEDAPSISVRTRYEERLVALRKILQQQKHSYPLGAILVSIGAITDEQLNRALSAQTSSHTNKLLGEFLVDMGITSREKLSHALAIQSRSAQPSYSRIV